MAFYADDIYTSSGSTNLQNAWTPYVSKFDTSTFYNWEQDNLPLYDLEERTYELWEQQGYPTSSIPGLSLVVSADTPELTLAADPNIFTTVSACIAAIPKVVRFPVLIEVCNFGDLGNLELHNFRIEEGGSIEIINRAFSKIYGASAITAIATLPSDNQSVNLTTVLSSTDLSSTLYSTAGLATSSVILSSLVLSAGDDTRNNTAYSFLYPKHSTRRAPLTVSIRDTSILHTNPDQFALVPYESFAPGTDATLPTTDISAITETATRNTYRDPAISTGGGTPLTGLISLNYLQSISVKNCDGPIYIRNFTVDGETTSTSGRKIGIDIQNSNVVLENCTATRCKRSGFRFMNSEAILSRAAFSYRNYDLSSSTSRIANTGIGFELINSNVTVSADITSTTGAYDRDASGYDVLFCASRNDKGFVLENSKLDGGFGRILVSDQSTGGIIASELNTSLGFEVNNSKIDLDGLIDIYANNIGLKAFNSNINFYNLSIEANNSKGIDSRNSIFTFDSKGIELASPSMGQGQYPNRHQVDFINNAEHISLENQSIFTFKKVTNAPLKFGGMFFSACHGVNSWNGTFRENKPAISAKQNSVVELIHAAMLTRLQEDTAEGPCYGMAVKALDNSKVSFYGTGSGCTAIVGPSAAKSEHAGLYAGRDSEISIHGPTMLGQFGVDILAEDNSVITVSPPKLTEKGLPDVSGFNLGSTLNHTSVELHSLAAGLVAHRNSTINLEDLGDFNNFWKNTSNGQTLLAAGTDYNPADTLDLSSYIKCGSLQFYPNPAFDEDATRSNLNIDSTIKNFPKFTGTGNQNYLLTGGGYESPNYINVSGISVGGVCVKAIGGSQVNVRNVHFPIAVNNSPLDGLYYNLSGSECDRLMIWNIADTSRLHAAFTSVSGSYPLDAGYHGPSALYFSATSPGAATYAPAYGAPSSTPDTGTLSVLDQFGAGSAVWVVPPYTELNSPFDQIASGILIAPTDSLPYGNTDGTFNNQGVFRIYFSVDSAAKLLQNDLSGYDYGAFPHTGNFSGVVGPVYQVFAQGYNMSAPVSALVPNGVTSVSALHPQLLKYDGTNIHTSGFYYCKEFVSDNPTQCILDEAASNTFANAKNASVGQSGKPKKVTLYRSRSSANDRAAESYNGDTDIAQFKSSIIFDLEREL